MKPVSEIYRSENEAVAIIGMSCLFPKSPGLKAFWRLLFNGLDGIDEVPDSHWSAQDYFSSDPHEKDHVYVKRGGFLPPTDFDPMEFGIPPNLMEATDTSQLLGLVVARQCLQDAGYLYTDREFDRDRVSVILGVTGTQELVIPLGARLGHPHWRRAMESAGIERHKAREILDKMSNSYVSWQEGSFPGLLGNVVAGRICNRLDLGGTNCVVDAACASSMSAVHLSLMELLSGRSDMVVTGGVDTLNDIFMHMCFASTQILSPSGDVRPFSKKADGTLLGEGIGMLALKRLFDAERDSDRIYAVIRGLGTSSDGRSQSIYSPRAAGQAKALRQAYRRADVAPASVELMEAHGTGTRVGDRVEMKALHTVFESEDAASNSGRPFCALGSVKSMIGHTKAAAGSAGLIKAALALHHKVLPATIKASNPDPDLHLQGSPFYLNHHSLPWFSHPNHPRRAGVSAFGFGGSNFHAVLEEYRPQKDQTSWDGSVEIVAISGANRDALLGKLRTWQFFFESHPAADDVARRAAASREKFLPTDKMRLMMVLEEPLEGSKKIEVLFAKAIDTLSERDDQTHWSLGNLHFGSGPKKERLVFMFPGQGSQYVRMGRDLACIFPEALALLEEANRSCDLPRRLSDYVYPPPMMDKESIKKQETALRSTDIAQPAIGAVSLMMARVLESFNLHPEITCGHSYGELCALFASNWIDLETLFHLSVMRGRYMADAGKSGGEAGGMLAVKAPLDRLQTLVDQSGIDDLILANRNSPSQGVLSGTLEAVEKAAALCKDHGFRTIKLPVAAAFHSRLVKNAQQPFARELEQVRIEPGEISVFSNTTAQAYPGDAAEARKILAEQMLCPVDFVNEIKNIFSRQATTFLEVGPRAVLTGLVRAILRGEDVHCLSLDASSGKKSGVADLARCLSQLAALGHPVNLNRWGGTPPPAPGKRPVMNIPISGANYRKPDYDPSGSASNSSDQNKLVVTRRTGKPSRPAAESIAAEKPQPITSSLPANDRKPQPSPKPPVLTVEMPAPYTSLAAQALEAVNRGLAAIEQLQQETVRTHQLFLENQKEATVALQRMMGHTHNVTEAALGLPTNTGKTEETAAPLPPSPPDLSPTDSWGVPPTAMTAERSSLSLANTQEQVGSSLDRQEALPPTVSQKPQDPVSKSAVNEQPPRSMPPMEKVLLEVVADLTGYPAETLRLDMDIEADLGIDSIKRVEILSAFEEKLPELPPISPDNVATLKTLGQIVDVLTEDSEDAFPPFEKKQAIVLPASTVESTRHTDASVAEKALLEVVADLTGYPAEMLRLDMDIEADLGIDSIKRVEILSAFEEKLPELPPISPDNVATLKTLGQIVDMLTAESSPKKLSNNSISHINTNKLVEFPNKLHQKSEKAQPIGWPLGIERQCVFPQESSFKFGSPLHFSDEKCFYILSSPQDELAEALASRLASRQIKTRQITFSEAIHPDFDPRDAAGLILIAKRDLPCEGEALYRGAFIKDAFSITRQFVRPLLAAAESGSAVFAAIARMDGCFGFSGEGNWSPLNAGLGGIVKTAAQEWTGVLCRSFDVSSDCGELSSVTGALTNELLTPPVDGSVEIGFRTNENTLKRMVPLLTPAYPDTAESEKLDLEPGDVMVISGGARGITAAAAHALAEVTHPTLVILGRTSAVFSEPSWLKNAVDQAEVKKAIFENEFSGTAAPVELERAYRRYEANREITANLKSFEKAGARVYYHSIDIRDRSGVNRILSEIKQQHGPVRALIHAAGVLEDHFITDKTPAHFERVFDTKVGGLGALLEVVDIQDLRYLVLFSSVAARMGNPGQADYAAANEVLNKIAQQVAIRFPDCRCLALNWGPWDGGMVSPALKREFARRGIDLIPVQEGVRCLQLEMSRSGDTAVEIVVGAGLTPDSYAETVSPAPQQQSKLSLAFKQRISPDNCRVLKSHVIDGIPVVPFALMAEWAAHGALHENPGLLLYGMRDTRLLKGIRFDGEEKVIRLMAGKARKNENLYEVEVEVRDGIVNGKETIHSRGTVLLAENLPQAPHFELEKHLSAESYQRSPQEIYSQILFHGNALQGIRRVLSSTRTSMVARIDAAPHPSDWVDQPMRSRWLIDPLVLDCAFQMAILWCYDQEGMVSLPSYSRAYTQYRQRFPEDGVTAVLEIQGCAKNRMRGDFTFLDEDGCTVARIEGYEAVMSPSLFNAFRTNTAA